jgi:hypothetical protein
MKKEGRKEGKNERKEGRERKKEEGRKENRNRDHLTKGTQESRKWKVGACSSSSLF